MSFNVDNWTDALTKKLKESFTDRLLFVGLQGSYKRGEAHPESDIDIVVILNHLAIEDLKTYKHIISSMPDKEKACGFISGKEEIRNWPKNELFQFINDTKTLLGSIKGIVPEISREDIKDYVKNSSASLYHMAVHSYLYDKTRDNFKFIIKSLFFLLQATYYLKIQKYFSSKSELLDAMSKEEKKIFITNVDSLSEIDFDDFCDCLIKYLSKELCS